MAHMAQPVHFALPANTAGFTPFMFNSGAIFIKPL
jgi:hypothetical protein